MQEALQASLFTYSAEATPLSASTAEDVSEVSTGVGVGVMVAEDWTCRACTFRNENSTGIECAMCGTSRNEVREAWSSSASSSVSASDEYTSQHSSDLI